MSKEGKVGLLRLALRLRARRPTTYLALHAGGGLLPALFSRLINAEFSVGPADSWAGLGYAQTVVRRANTHKADYYMSYAEQLFGPSRANADASRLFPLSHDKTSIAVDLLAGTEGQRLIAIAPGTSPVETHKLWPLHKYRELASRLVRAAQDVHIVLIGARSEESQLASLVTEEYSHRMTVVAEDEITVSLAVLRRAACLVGTCGGAAHMASLVDAPVVGIFGPTNPTVTGPSTAKLRVVRKGYGCSPCYRSGFVTGCGDPRCIADIEVNEVLRAVLDTLDGLPFPPRLLLRTTTAVRCEAPKLGGSIRSIS